MEALAQYDERAPSAIVSEAISSQSRLVLADLRLFGIPTSAVGQGYHHGKNFSMRGLSTGRDLEQDILSTNAGICSCELME